MIHIAKLWHTIKSDSNSNSKTLSVISMQNFLSPTDRQTQSLESVIQISRPACLSPTDCLTPSIEPVNIVLVLTHEGLTGST